ncbi:MAG: DNA mismatch repair endonuclease MutL [Acidobacteriota bacterium]|nr:DNA mismatch repair endonuclease MutL [Acidobacteriota bacterium]
MGRIRRLPPAVANQIAAGEVVERPAAVVRELVENSIDAGATAVSVRVRDAGRTEIRVSDDGVGMTPEDARLAIERHATSKIESVDDLTSIGSLGFRGEALPSIASVSRFRLRTRGVEADSGWEIEVEGGTTVSERPAGTRPGTVVEVRDLFFNTPARRKFLRAEKTESSHIVQAVSNLALAWPQIRFDLQSGDTKVFALEPGADAAERLRQLDPRWARDAIPIEARAGDLTVRAFLSPPMARRGAASRLLLFLNGRPIKDRRLFHAVTEAYRRLSSLSGTPKAYVFVEAPPDAVDVNVHPAKSEVRFADPEAAWGAVFRGVRAGLEGSPKRVDLGVAGGVRVERPPAETAAPAGGVGAIEGGAAPRGDRMRRRAGWDGAKVGEVLYGGDRVEEPVRASYLDFGATPPKVLGQFRRTYILAEERSELLVVDQHAADERVIFNRLMERSSEIRTQELLQPVPLELSPVERAALADEHERLAAAGFDIEPFGGDAWILRGVPEALGVGRGLDVLMRSLASEESECTAAAAHDARARIMARVACHAAVTAGVTLTTERMHEVLASLWGTANPSTCPHGRPTVLRLDLPFIERRFGRI